MVMMWGSELVQFHDGSGQHTAEAVKIFREVELVPTLSFQPFMILEVTLYATRGER